MGNKSTHGQSMISTPISIHKEIKGNTRGKIYFNTKPISIRVETQDTSDSCLIIKTLKFYMSAKTHKIGESIWFFLVN